jgi:ABC-type transporter Mla MlaB component
VEYHIEQRKLRVQLIRDFNLLTARQVEKLANEVDSIEIDLSRAKIVDSVAIVTLFRLVSSGKKVKLFEPPAIFGEAVRLLGLDRVLKLEELVVNK